MDKAEPKGKEQNVKRIFHPDAETAGKVDRKKLKAAAYCRVSTKSEGQHTSYQTQVSVFEDYIKANPDWEFVGIYADDGITAKRVTERKDFLRMIEDCEDGLIDLIITKSISRFSRNTLDALTYIRHMKDIGVRIIFQKENIDTGAAYSEMLLTVLTAFAQEESRSLGENVRRGIQMRHKMGQPRWVNILGYTKDDENEYIIVPEEAAIVHRIFDQYEIGTTPPVIAAGLEADGIPSRFGMHWDDSVIRAVIKNEKYAGDVMMQKNYTPGMPGAKQERNLGQRPTYYVKDHHKPIISRKQFDRCNRIMSMKICHGGDGRFRYPFGDYVRCPYCGQILSSRKTQIQERETVYCCEGDGSCRDFVISKALVLKAVLTAYREVDLDAVRAVAGGKDHKLAKQANVLLAFKEKHPEMDTIEYYWLDELVEKIIFGRHERTEAEIAAGEEDDRTITLAWRCGIKTTVPSGVNRDSRLPRHRAELWEGYLLRYPDKFPELLEEETWK
jgi:DNA invertase Pin-like site-specific DNA recombinase